MLTKAESSYVDAVVNLQECEDEARTIRFMNTMAESGPDSEHYSYWKSMFTIRQEDKGYENWIRAVIRHLGKKFKNPANLVLMRLEESAPESEFHKEFIRRRTLVALNKGLKKIGLRAELTLHSIDDKFPVVEKPFGVKDKQFNKLFR